MELAKALESFVAEPVRRRTACGNYGMIGPMANLTLRS